MRRKKKTKAVKRILVTLTLLLVCLTAAGWASQKNKSEERGFTDFAHIETEYLKTLEKLSWPEGVTLPTKLEGEDETASFQVGYGDIRASNLWEYSWMKEWLDTYETEPERAKKSN